MKKPAVKKGKRKGARTQRMMNCWEFMKCGREVKGTRAEELGVCAAAVDPHADGINRGINGGRICWAIVGTYSCYVGKSFLSEKKILCYDCEFHKKVLLEEGIIDFDTPKEGRPPHTSSQPLPKRRK